MKVSKRLMAQKHKHANDECDAKMQKSGNLNQENFDHMDDLKELQKTQRMNVRVTWQTTEAKTDTTWLELSKHRATRCDACPALGRGSAGGKRHDTSPTCAPGL